MSSRAVELSIITPAEWFYSGKVESVRVTTMDGEEGFKAGHAWCVKLLAPDGHVRLRPSAADGDEPQREKSGEGPAAGSGNAAGSGCLRVAALKGGHIDIKDRFVIYAGDAAWVESK